jgi:hypothetical protein
MSAKKRQHHQGGGQARQQRPADTSAFDLWRPPPALPAPAKITPSTDPSLLLRSLGDPPLGNKSVLAGHYLAALVERAAGLATALAVSADLLATDAGED